MAYTLQYSTAGAIFSCVQQGLPAGINETVRIYLSDGKYEGKTYVDGLIVSVTPADVYDPAEDRIRGGYIYDIQIEDDDMPAGVTELDPTCDIKRIGCPADVNLNWITHTFVKDARLVDDEDNPGCFKLEVTKQTFQFVGTPTGFEFKEYSRICESPYGPYSDPASW